MMQCSQLVLAKESFRRQVNKNQRRGMARRGNVNEQANVFAGTAGRPLMERGALKTLPLAQPYFVGIKFATLDRQEKGYA